MKSEVLMYSLGIDRKHLPGMCGYQLPVTNFLVQSMVLKIIYSELSDIFINIALKI